MATLDVTINGDASGAIGAIQQTQAALGSLAGPAASAGSGLDHMFQEGDRAGSGLRDLARAAGTIGPVLSEAAGAGGDAANMLSSVASAALSGAASGGAVGASFGGATAIFAAMAGSLSDVEPKINAAAAALANLGRSSIDLKPASFNEGTAAIGALVDKAGGGAGNIETFGSALRSTQASAAASHSAYSDLTSAEDNLAAAHEQGGNKIFAAAAASTAAAQVQTAYAAAVKESSAGMIELAQSQSAVAAGEQALGAGTQMMTQEFQSANGAVLVLSSSMNSAFNQAPAGFSMQDLLGNPGGNATPHASGGPVSPGSMYLVGEQGPELFVSGDAGQIIPNGGVGGGTMVFNFNNSGSLIGPGADRWIMDSIRSAVVYAGALRGFLGAV